MRKKLLPLVSAVLLSLVVAPGLAQRGLPDPSGVTHTLYGDLKVDETAAGAPAEGSYRIVLTHITARVMGRQSVSNNGRFRFLDVPNGDYILTVELAGKEVMREEFHLEELRSTDIRKDLNLVWEARGARAGGTAQVVYARSGENEALWTSANEAQTAGDVQEAIRLLEQVTAADKEDYEAWTELGSLYFRQNKSGPAEKAYRQALDAQPDYALAGLNLGKVLYGKQKFDEAIEILENVVAKTAGVAEAHMFLGECYLQVKKGSKAVPHLEQALELEPDRMAEAHLRLGTLYRAAGYADLAVAEFQQYLKKRPDAPEKKDIENFINKNQQP